MKRYDTDDEMHAALEVFLFDTLSDPELECVEAPAEPAFTELEPKPAGSVYTVKAQASNGKVYDFHVGNLPRTRRECRYLASILLAPAKGLDKATAKARLELALACLQKAVELS